MSMDIYFSLKGTSAIIEFPFQSRGLGIELMNEPDLEKQMVLIEKDIRSWTDWTEDQVEEKLVECRELLEHDALELFLM